MMSNDVLQHYASKYYDPVKAHEYYMKNRELKGRTNTRSTAALNAEGKEIWKVTKDGIREEYKENVDKEKTSMEQKVASARANATQSRERISQRLKELNDALDQRSKDLTSQKSKDIQNANAEVDKAREKILKDTEDKVNQLQASLKVEGLTDAQRMDIQSKISKTLKDATANRYKVEAEAYRNKSNTKDMTADERSNIANEKRANSQNASNEKAKVAQELKATVSAEREKWKAVKEKLTSDREATYDSEYEKILSKYANPKSKSRKK